MIAAIMEILKLLFSRDDVIFECQTHQIQKHVIEYDLSNEPLKVVNQINDNMPLEFWDELNEDDDNQGNSIDLAA
jgi:hypothetical protein